MTENYFGHVPKTPEILPTKNKMSLADRVRQHGQNTQFRYLWTRLEINFYQSNKSVNTLIHSDIHLQMAANEGIHVPAAQARHHEY